MVSMMKPGSRGFGTVENSSIFVGDFDGSLKQIQIPEMRTPEEPIMTQSPTPVSSAATTFGKTSTMLESNRVAQTSTAELPIILTASGFLFLTCMIFVAWKIYIKHTKSSNFMPPIQAFAARTNTHETENLTTITEITQLFASNVPIPTITGLTTTTTHTIEVSIPAFLEMQWGLDFCEEELIAKGGGGSVYRGRSLNADLSVQSQYNSIAVKNVARALETMSGRQRICFFQEVALMHRFRDHPNFIRLYAYSTRPVTMVLKMYELGDLAHFIHGRSPVIARRFVYSKATLVSLIFKFSGCIQYMHNNGVVHCDIKPANVLLDVDSNDQLIPIISDFGISRILSSEALKVKAFEVADLRGASLAYAAPETIVRLRQYTQETDPRIWMAADIYSLGISINEMITRTYAW